MLSLLVHVGEAALQEYVCAGDVRVVQCLFLPPLQNIGHGNALFIGIR